MHDVEAGSAKLSPAAQQRIASIECEVLHLTEKLEAWDAEFKTAELERVESAIRQEATGGWAPVDLIALASGFEPERPTVGFRQDGAGVFYARRLNLVFGESESGKSWLAFFVAAQVLNDGGRVAVIDLEDDERGFFERMTTVLGVPVSALDRAAYINPFTALTDAGHRLLKPLFEACELVIIDAATEALAAYGKSSNSDVEVAEFYGSLPKRIAALGPAVVLIDHTPKDFGNRGGPQGSQHKRAGADGVAYLVQRVRPFSPSNGGEGLSRILVNKDRRGGVRLEAVSAPGGKQFADFLISAGKFELAKPSLGPMLSADQRLESRLDLLRHAIVRMAKLRKDATKAPFGSARKIQEALRADGRVKFSNSDINKLFLNDLVESGFLDPRYGFLRSYESPVIRKPLAAEELGGTEDVL